ncbi:MAG: hypothetical protein NTV52_17400 [Acidobacteria bacterium]|nr:hypothetical protein [Acidobacteriota bacterium]
MPLEIEELFEAAKGLFGDFVVLAGAFEIAGLGGDVSFAELAGRVLEQDARVAAGFQALRGEGLAQAGEGCFAGFQAGLDADASGAEFGDDGGVGAGRSPLKPPTSFSIGGGLRGLRPITHYPSVV